MTHMEQIEQILRLGNAAMMGRHDQAIENLKLVIDLEVRRLNALVEVGASDGAIAAEATRAFAAVAQARADLP